MSRKYAYQILLIEEFARHGVETVFVKSPQGDSAEDQLLVQFQGMIAEYERAQILERSCRGKRHRAQAGEVSVLSGAPYGYRYIRKTDEVPAAYVVDEAEARVVRRVYEMYTIEGLSIGEITRRLNTEDVPARSAGRWEHSVVWGVLRNPAYRGVACFGKTHISARTQVMRPQRRRDTTTPSTTAGHQRPREEWIEIPVPALVTEESFARLELHPDKTRLIEFGRNAAASRKARGEGKPETFNLLGFTHICGQTWKRGKFIVLRKTIRKQLSAKPPRRATRIASGIWSPRPAA